jgi:hypothetical protein
MQRAAKTSVVNDAGIDFDAGKSYESNLFDEEEKEPQESLVVEPMPSEYIFLVDRSGSMDNTIGLVRKAL